MLNLVVAWRAVFTCLNFYIRSGIIILSTSRVRLTVRPRNERKVIKKLWDKPVRAARDASPNHKL